MKKGLGILFVFLLAFGIATTVNAKVLTFDDISGNTIGAVPDGYGGLDWNNMGYIKDTYHPVSGYNNGIVSGDYVAFNQYVNVATVDDGLFDFNGAYFTGAWNNRLNIEVTGFLNGVQQYQETIIVDTFGPTWLAADFFGIDSLSFRSFGGIEAELPGSGEHFAMDDFTFNEKQSVPEPATMLLLGTGLIGLVGLRRKITK